MRRSVRLSLAALAAAALMSSSQVVSVAAPAPSPQPPSGSQRREAERKMTGAPAKSHKASKPDFGKAPKHPNLGGASTPLKRLIRDWDAGRLSKQGARTIASEMLGVALKRDGAKVPSRYKGRLNVDDLVALSGLAEPSTSAAPAKVEPRYGSGPGCDLDCVVTSEHFNFWYWPGRQSADDLADRDGNGIPDRAENTLETLEDAWTYFHVNLGMRAPGGTISFYWNSPNLTLTDGRAASLFTDEIYVSANYGDADIPYLPVHELFHQFQWQYLTSAVVNIGVYGNSLRINWWMEATAEWASKEYALSRSNDEEEQATVIRRAGASIPQFWPPHPKPCRSETSQRRPSGITAPS